MSTGKTPPSQRNIGDVEVTDEQRVAIEHHIQAGGGLAGGQDAWHERHGEDLETDPSFADRWELKAIGRAYQGLGEEDGEAEWKGGFSFVVAADTQ